MKAQLKEWIAQGKTNKVIQQLLEVAKNIEDVDLQKEVTLHSNRYENFAQKQRTGAITVDEEKVTLAQINTGLLDFIDRLPDDIVKPVNRNNKVFQWLFVVGMVIVILANIDVFSNYFNSQEEGTQKKMPVFDNQQVKETNSNKAENPANTNQTSTGAQSPNIKTESGDVNLQFGKITKEGEDKSKQSKTDSPQPTKAQNQEGIHQSSEGDQSPKVITKDGNVDIKYDDWSTPKKDTSGH